MSEQCAHLAKKIKYRTRGWFDSIYFWPLSEKLQIRASQAPTEGNLINKNMTEVLVKIINKSGKFLLVQKSPCIMLPGEENLLKQVYSLAMVPKHGYPELQEVMKEFCFSFPNFKPPKTHWPKEGDLLD
jgi:hypothetical protein